MFGNPKSASSELGLQNAANNANQNAAFLSQKFGGKADLCVPLYQQQSASSSSELNTQNTQTNLCSGSTQWQQQVTTFVSSYDTASYGGTTTAGYGGSDPVPVVSTKHFNQGIGNGMEGGDPGKSQPHGGSNDEGGRTPGQRWIPKLFGF